MINKKKGRADADRTMATYIARVVRNAMEDFHARHLSDAQMKELIPIIRNAVYTALYAARQASKSKGARAFVRFQTTLIPHFWEDRQLLDDYLTSVGLKEGGV